MEFYANITNFLRNIAVPGGITAAFLALGAFTVAGISHNVNQQIKELYPKIESRFTLTKEAMAKGRYDDAKRLAVETQQSVGRFRLVCSGYENFFYKGIEANQMGFDNEKLMAALEVLVKPGTLE